MCEHVEMAHWCQPPVSYDPNKRLAWQFILARLTVPSCQMVEGGWEHAKRIEFNILYFNVLYFALLCYI